MLRPYQEGVTLVGPGGSWGDLAAGEAVASGLLERGETIGQHIFCAGDAGAGNQIEETGRASGDFREAVVGGSWSAEKDAVEMMHGENAAIVFGFFRREVRDEDAIGAGDCCGGSEFFETHLQDGIVVAEEDERNLR